MTPLTREMILNEPAGARMDQWIARLVLGEQPPDGSDLNAATGRWEMWEPIDDREEALREWPRAYSGNIASAWEVLERVACRKHWSYQITSQEGYDSGPLYWIEIQHGRTKWYADSRYYFDDEALDSVPLAICRSALLATLEPETAT